VGVSDSSPREDKHKTGREGGQLRQRRKPKQEKLLIKQGLGNYIEKETEERCHPTTKPKGGGKKYAKYKEHKRPNRERQSVGDPASNCNSIKKVRGRKRVNHGGEEKGLKGQAHRRKFRGG